MTARMRVLGVTLETSIPLKANEPGFMANAFALEVRKVLAGERQRPACVPRGGVARVARGSVLTSAPQRILLQPCSRCTDTLFPDASSLAPPQQPLAARSSTTAATAHSLADAPRTGRTSFLGCECFGEGCMWFTARCAQVFA